MLSGALGTLQLLFSLTTSTSMPAAPPVTTARATTAEATTADVAITDRAPDFEVATAYGWHRFSEIHGDAPIVLVFEPDEATLATLERELPALTDRGVAIAAVTRDPDGTNWDRLEHLGLTYALWSDPGGHVAELFGMDRAPDDRPGPAWCLVDARGRIVDREHGVEADRLVSEVAREIPAANVTASGDAMR